MPVHFELGVRTAYAVPFGAAVGDADDINTLVMAQVPLWFDVGARFAESIFVGLNVAYGFGVLSHDSLVECRADAVNGVTNPRCGAHDLRIGLELEYQPATKSRFSPWFGGGVGWEWLTLTESADVQGQPTQTSAELDGPQLFMFEGGVDYTLVPALRLGLFVAFSMDMYVSASTSCRGGCAASSGSVQIDNNTPHEWLFGGARATLMP